MQLGELSRNREAPCAAQPAGAGAPPRAIQRDHPPLLDRPVLPFVSNKCHRPSELALWRAIPLCRRTPAPVARFGCADIGWLVRARSPGTPSSTRRRRRPSRLVRLPSTSPDLGRSPVARFRLRRQRMTPRPLRFRLVNPVGPSNEATPQRGHHSLEAVPRAPVGVRLPVRRPLCTRRFRQVKGYFSTHRVIHRHPAIPRSFPVRPPSVHRLCTCSRQDRTSGRVLVDDPTVSGHNDRHDVAAPVPHLASIIIIR